MKKMVLLLLLFFCGSKQLSANFLHVRNFSKNSYQAGTQNWDIAQTNGRHLYFANNAGLLEFDGAEWTLRYMPNYTMVRSLEYDPELERVYAGAFQEFGYFEPSPGGELQYKSMIPLFPEWDRVNEIWDIHQIEKKIYFRSDWKILRYSEGEPKAFDFASKIDCSAAIYNTLFVATQADGVRILSGDMFIPLPNSEVMVGRKICAILPYMDNQVMFVSDLDGIFLYDGKATRKFSSNIDKYLYANRVFTAATNGKVLALGSVGDGLFIMNLEDGGLMQLNRDSGLQNNTILALQFDNDDNLWLGLDNGIDYVILNSPEYSLFPGNNHYGAGYASLVSGNNIYLGTNQGLFYGKKPTVIKTEISSNSDYKAVAHTQGQVWCLTEIDNTVFCGHDRGLYEINGGVAHKIEGVDGVLKLIELEGSRDLILGCSYGGLFVLKKSGGRWFFSHKVEDFEESSGMFTQGVDGSIWFNHWMKGLFRLTLSGDKRRVERVEYFGDTKGLPTNRNNIPYRVGADMIFSSDSGFYKFDPLLDSMVLYDKINSLFLYPPQALRLHISPEESIYFMSDKFLGTAFKGDNAEYVMDSLSLRFLLGELIFGFEDISFIDNKTVLLSNLRGFSLIDLSKLDRHKDKSRQETPVLLKGVFLTNRQDSLIYGQRNKGDTLRPIELSYRDNSLRFEFIASEYRAENVVMYSYMLEGYDLQWTNFSSIMSKEYTGLKEGVYEFKVRAKNSFTDQISQSSFAFTILPPWYQSTVMKILYLVLMVGVILIIVWYFQKHSDKRVLEMKTRKERELAEQRKKYEKSADEREKELSELKIQTLEYDLRNKTQEMASSTLNLVRKNEILLKIQDDLAKVLPNINTNISPVKASSQIRRIQTEIKNNIERDMDWKKFQHNFDMVYENYLLKLCERFPKLNMNDQKLCAYLKMNLQTKDIAPLMNMSTRSVEMIRHRLRKKMDLDRSVNMTEFLQKELF